MGIEDILIRAADRYPAWVVVALLTAAALSFLARHRAQYRYGRIREYGPTAVGMAAGLLGLAVFYAVIHAGVDELAARPVVLRVLLSLLSVAAVAFNWGGVRVMFRDVRDAIQRE